MKKECLSIDDRKLEILLGDLENQTSWYVKEFCVRTLSEMGNSIPESKIIEVVDTLLNQIARSFSGTTIGCFIPFLPESKVTSVIETLISTLRNKSRPKNDDGTVEEDNWFARVEAAHGLGAILSYIPESQKIPVCREILNGLIDPDDSVKEACADVFESIIPLVSSESKEDLARSLNLMADVQKSCHITAANILSRSAIFKNERNIK